MVSARSTVPVLLAGLTLLPLFTGACGGDETVAEHWCNTRQVHVRSDAELPEYVTDLHVDSRDRTWVGLFGRAASFPGVHRDDNTVLRLSPSGQLELELHFVGDEGDERGRIFPRPNGGFCRVHVLYLYDEGGPWTLTLSCFDDRGQEQWRTRELDIAPRTKALLVTPSDEVVMLTERLEHSRDPERPADWAYTDTLVRRFSATGELLASTWLDGAFGSGSVMVLAPDESVYVLGGGAQPGLARVTAAGEFSVGWLSEPRSAHAWPIDLELRGDDIIAAQLIDSQPQSFELLRFGMDGELVESRRVESEHHTRVTRLVTGSSGGLWALFYEHVLGPERWESHEYRMQLGPSLADAVPEPMPETPSPGPRFASGDLAYALQLAGSANGATQLEFGCRAPSGEW